MKESTKSMYTLVEQTYFTMKPRGCDASESYDHPDSSDIVWRIYSQCFFTKYVKTCMNNWNAIIIECTAHDDWSNCDKTWRCTAITTSCCSIESVRFTSHPKHLNIIYLDSSNATRHCWFVLLLKSNKLILLIIKYVWQVGISNLVDINKDFIDETDLNGNNARGNWKYIVD